MKKKYRFVIVLLLFISFISCNSEEKSGLRQPDRPQAAAAPPESFADLAERVKPAVVNISTTTVIKVPGTPFHFFSPEEDSPFRRFFGDAPDRELRQKSLGSGFIIDKDGLILTNAHVVAKATEIVVRLADGRELKAKVIGADPKTDIALIKISSPFKDLPVLALGDSESMRVGDWVIAVGNPFGLGHTVTQGIISGTERVIGAGPYDNFLQTDAPINPGNSGGPLINMRSEVIGINSAIIATGQGIGFSIPSNTAKVITSQLKEKGKVVRGWIGVSVQSITPEIAEALGLEGTQGALVAGVSGGGPADRAGVRSGDVITSFNAKKIEDPNDLSRAVAETAPGETVPVMIVRKGREQTLNIAIREG